MAQRKPMKTPGSEWLDKISDMFGDADKNLDQVKKSVKGDLDTLKKSKDLQNLAANLYLSAEKGFRKDLEELGITGDKQNEYVTLFKESWQKQEMSKKSNEILKSPELAAMDAFISKAENLPKIKGLIDSAEPQAKWQTMVSSWIGKFPGIEKYMGNLAPILSSLGLGFLAPAAKKLADKAKKKEDNPFEKPKDKDGKEKPAEKKEEKETLGKPKSTLFMGDSNTVAMTSAAKGILKVDGKIGSKAKGGESAKWGADQAEAMAKQKPNPLKEYENVVALFGTNDLLSSSKTIIDNLKRLYKVLKDSGVKIYAATIPPVKGGSYNKAGSYERANKTRKEVNDWIRKTRGEGRTHRVIDLCKSEKDGGLASDKDADKLAKSGDGIHFDKRDLAKIYQRELEKGSGSNKA